ncbi:MAG: hypothetical protein ACTJH9_06640 [Pseudoalteromonas sp.]|uniref:hypothetical protein n=1 Tax=unclassified Pseudoalteromonas TaxID=194690 RepID=UPI003F98F7CE
MSFSSLIKFPIFITALALLSSCGGDNTKKDINFEVEETGLVISANNGLVESFDNNLVQLNAPANSVTTDTSFIFSKAELDTPNKELNIVSPLYTFSPQDLVFKKPVTIKIDVTSTEPQQLLTIVQLIDGLWQPLTTITSGSNSVSASMTNFGTFAVQTRTEPTITTNIGPTCTANQSSQTLRFIHVADLHARFGFKEKYFSHIKGYYNNAIAEQPYTVFTNGGDDYEKGTVAEQTSMGKATVEAIKAMEFDVRVIGNHDYAWGPEQLVEYANDDHAIVLASNTSYEGSPQSKTLME